jgi:hypothetical protein
MFSQHRLINWYRVMGINKKINIYLTPFLGWGLILLCGFSCGPTELPRLNLEFEIPVSTIPAKEIYSIGDTLTIEIEFTKNLTDVNNTYTYNFEEFNFNGMIRMNKIGDKNLQSGLQPGGLPLIKIYNLRGGFYPFSDAGAQFEYEFSNDYFILKSKYVLQQEGVYSISFFTNFDEFSGFNNKLNIEGKIAYVNNIFYKINQGQTNFHLLFENSKINWQEETNKPGENSIFTFRVIEE